MDRQTGKEQKSGVEFYSFGTGKYKDEVVESPQSSGRYQGHDLHIRDVLSWTGRGRCAPQDVASYDRAMIHPLRTRRNLLAAAMLLKMQTIMLSRSPHSDILKSHVMCRS